MAYYIPIFEVVFDIAFDTCHNVLCIVENHIQNYKRAILGVVFGSRITKIVREYNS